MGWDKSGAVTPKHPEVGMGKLHPMEAEEEWIPMGFGGSQWGWRDPNGVGGIPVVFWGLSGVGMNPDGVGMDPDGAGGIPVGLEGS